MTPYSERERKAGGMSEQAKQDQYEDMAARELAADAARERDSEDLALLAKLRAHPGFGAVLYMSEQNRDYVGNEFEPGPEYDAFCMLLQLLRGEP